MFGNTYPFDITVSTNERDISLSPNSLASRKFIQSISCCSFIFVQILTMDTCSASAEYVQGSEFILSQPSKVRGLKELQALKDLQDDRLDQCADRGIFWEQCFMYGESSSESITKYGTKARTSKFSDINQKIRNGLDYQMISPLGAMEPENSDIARRMPPTW